MGYMYEFIKGLWKQHPIFRLVLGMCPTLAVTNMAFNGLVMGLAVIFVLISSGIVVSLIRNIIPSKVRIPVYIVIIATFVTIADYFLAAYIPGMHKVLSIYVPLIVVNCIILARMEAFASRHSIGKSVTDALGMGLGFTLGLIIISSIRELLGFGSLFGITILYNFNPMIVMRTPTGAFITLGLLIGLMNIINTRIKALSAKEVAE